MMGQFEDLTGKKFGKLTVIRRVFPNTKNGTSRWLCLCDCGNETTVAVTKLSRGSTVSCGCYRRRANGKARTRLYHIWQNMIRRCENPHHDHYSRYGGRGVKVCEEWHDFSVFQSWATKNGYTDQLSIDRMDNNAGYSPDNCRWTTQKEQMQNTTNTIKLTVNREQYTITQLAQYLNIPRYTVVNNLRAGRTAEEIVERYKEQETEKNA